MAAVRDILSERGRVRAHEAVRAGEAAEGPARVLRAIVGARVPCARRFSALSRARRRAVAPPTGGRRPRHARCAARRARPRARAHVRLDRCRSERLAGGASARPPTAARNARARALRAPLSRRLTACHRADRSPLDTLLSKALSSWQFRHNAAVRVRARNSSTRLFAPLLLR